WRGTSFYMSAVQHRLHQGVPLIAQLQGEEGLVLPGDQVQEDGVPLPVGDLQQAVPGNPLQHPLVALLQLPGEAVSGEQVHILGGQAVGDKGDDPPVAVVRQGEAGLLAGLPEEAVLRALLVLELPADADPLVLIQVVFLLDPVEHQVFVTPADITERCIDHGYSSKLKPSLAATLSYMG